jgi:glycosyltransferase involved in cell wall biosynthesis
MGKLDSWFENIRDSLQKTGQQAFFLEYNELLDKDRQKALLEFLSVDQDIPLESNARKQNSDAYRNRFENPEEVTRVLENAGYSRWLIDDTETALAVRLNEEAESAFHSGDMGSAEKLFHEAHEADPNNVEVLNNLGVLYWETGEPEKSIAYMVQALEIDPDNRDSVINSAKMLMASGCREESHALCESYLKNFPGDEEIAELLASETVDSTSNTVQSPNAAGESICVTKNEYDDARYSAAAPKISIVIPSYNQGEYLEQTICSVLEQRYPNLELVIMDGGSTDGSVEIIRKYEDQLTYWQSEKDKGQYWAINEGFKRTTGEIMAWINSDDKFHSGAFSAIASIFDQQPGISWVTGTPNIMNEKGELSWVCSVPPIYSRKYYLAKKYDYPNYIQQEGTFWRRTLWEKAGGKLKTSLKMAGDLELWMRFFRHSRLYTTDMLLGCFRQHGGQKTQNNLQLYRKEALKELNREITRFKKSNQILPEDAPLIVISNKEALCRDYKVPGSKARETSGSSSSIVVTAIVSTYNSEKFIRGCLDDLELQTIADKLEIIVVDSGSEQNERAIVEEFQKRYSNIVYIRTNERETIYSAWNRGVAAAKGKYLTNANTDDRHRPDAFERMVSELEANPDVALVYADSAVTSAENSSFNNAPVEAFFRWPEFNARDLFSDCYIGPHPMWRRSLHDKYGLFDAQMKVAGDYEFWLRAGVSESFRHIPDVLGLYLRSPDSVQHAMSGNAGIETGLARSRNWPVEWGEPPEPGRSYLVSADEVNSYGDERDKSTPLVSIIMPTRNRLDLLGRALDSVIAQTYRHWELIVVNDGGDDISPVVNGRASCGRVRSIKLEQSGGQAAARNIALKEAKGEIICYLDDDDTYQKNHLETVVTALTRDGFPFVYTDAVLVTEQYDKGMLTETGERSNPYQHDDYSRDRLLVNNYIPINTWAHWKACLDEVGVFDESLNCYEDWEFLLRFSARYNFTHIQKTTVEVMCRVDRVDSVTRQRLSESADAFRVIYERHGDNLSEHLGRERSLRLRALEFNAEKQRQALLDTETGVGLEDVEDQEDSRAISDKHQLEDAHKRFLQRAEVFNYALPSIHLIMVVEENDIASIADTIDSLGQQIYAGWGLSVISAAPPPHGDFDALPMLEWIQSDDVEQSFIGAAQQSECDWIGSVTAGDTLESEALAFFVDYINRNPAWKFIYSDEDCVDTCGNQVSHKFKPDINPDYLYSSPYTGNLSLVHRDMLEQLSTDIGVPAASFFDLALKVLEQHGEPAFGHIPTLLYHQLQDNECREARNTWVRPVLEAYVTRNNIDAGVLDAGVAGTCMIDYRCLGTPAVCIAIYAGNDLAKAERTVASLLNKTVYSNWTVRIGLDRAFAPQLEKYQIDQLSVDSLDQNTDRCTYFDNLAQKVDAEYMVFMEPGVIVLQDNWLERLLAQGLRPEIGVVGIRLLSPQNKIAHAGILTGIGTFGVGGCIGEGDTLEQEGYMQRSQVVQNLSAVSSACMLVKRSLYQSLQGFDAKIAVSLYRDVDFCLRVKETGKRIVWTPFVTMLIPDERLDIYTGDDGISRVEKDARQLTSKWLQKFARDPAYNRNLTLARADYSVETDFRPVWDPNIRDLPGITGCGYGSYVVWAYRVAQPLEALSVAGKARHSRVPFKGQTLDRMPSVVEMERAQPDVLLLQNSLHDTCLDSLRQYRDVSNMFMVFGQDDLMFAVPPKSPRFKSGYSDINKRLRTCLSLVDRLVVTNEALADELSGFISDIRIVPNYLDAGMWGKTESRRGCGVKPRVGWAGAMQHYGDLEIIADAVRETADEVDWIFMGMCPDFLRPYVREVHEYVAFSAYPAALAKLNLDLAVAPLERNRFNRCKSNLRILEYGAMGWPVIATDIEPYQDAPVHRVSNKTRAWVNAIREHIHDLDASWKAGDTLQEWVRENHILQQHLDDWLDALDPSDGSRHQLLTPGKASGL